MSCILYVSSCTCTSLIRFGWQNGRIAEQGTYADLMAHGKEFARLMQEFGGKTQEEEDEAEAEEDIAEAAKHQAPAIDDAKNKSASVQRKGAGTGKLEGRLIVREKRTTGSVSYKGRTRPHSRQSRRAKSMIPQSTETILQRHARHSRALS